jgi:hypothetical protein
LVTVTKPTGYQTSDEWKPVGPVQDSSFRRRAETEDFDSDLVRRSIEEYLLVDRIPHSLVELFHGTGIKDVVEA